MVHRKVVWNGPLFKKSFYYVIVSDYCSVFLSFQKSIYRSIRRLLGSRFSVFMDDLVDKTTSGGIAKVEIIPKPVLPSGSTKDKVSHVSTGLFNVHQRSNMKIRIIHKTHIFAILFCLTRLENTAEDLFGKYPLTYKMSQYYNFPPVHP